MGEENMEEKASCSSSNVNAAATTAPGTGGGVPTPPQADDFSTFLHHFLLRSSASSSSHAHQRDPHHHPHQLHPLFLPTDIHRLPPPVDGIPAPDASAVGYFPAGSGPHAPSFSLGASGNDTDDYDCESEEGLEALLEDTPARPDPPRSSSKRSRTAEVHNLSEKRRRSRINEKMKALQSLIPNSNKTDKASMLDEAIEYLKQLQLQVQMLSMRNGLTLHPMCMPGVLQPVQIPQMRALFGEETENLLTNMTGHSVPINQETPPQQTTFSSPDQRTSNEPHMTNMFGSGSSFGLESSLQIRPGPYQLNSSSEELCREDMLRHRQSNVDHPETSLFGGPSRYAAYSLPKSEYEAGARAAVSLPFGSQPSTNVKLSGRDQAQR